MNRRLEHIGDRLIHKVTTPDLRSYLAWLHTEYKPRRFNGSTEPLSGKTIRIVWATLSALFSLNRF